MEQRCGLLFLDLLVEILFSGEGPLLLVPQIELSLGFGMELFLVSQMELLLGTGF